MTNNEGISSSATTKIEANSPFFLGPQDRLGDFITSVRLRLDNFDDWAHAIRVALSSRRKFGFLDGTIKELQPPCTKDDWVCIQCMLVSWLMNTIDPEVRSMLSNYDNAKLLWDDLNERFAVVNGPRIQQLKSDIARCEQPKTMSVAIYFSKLKVLWDELSNYEPILRCKCGKCSCFLGKAHEKRREEEQLNQFLMGLCSEYYSQIRSTLLSQEPLPSLNRAFQQVMQDERVRGVSRNKDEKPEIVGFAVRTEGRGRIEKSDKSNLFCSHCQRSGHDLEHCFEVIGYPDWWEERYGSLPKLEGKGATGARGKTNISRPSRTVNRSRGGVRANVTTTTRVDSQMDTSTTPTTNTTPPGFSTSQWQALVAAFGNPQAQINRLNGPTFEGADWNG